MVVVKVYGIPFRVSSCRIAPFCENIRKAVVGYRALKLTVKEVVVFSLADQVPDDVGKDEEIIIEVEGLFIKPVTKRVLQYLARKLVKTSIYNLPILSMTPRVIGCFVRSSDPSQGYFQTRP